jgi:DNA polymerase I-like protein with 3'-5' exonuclease and polymerase domains
VNVESFLADLRAQGVLLGARGDNLLVWAPKPMWTPGLRAAVRQHKQALLSLLPREVALTQSAASPMILRDAASLLALADAIVAARRVGLVIVATGLDARLDMLRAVAVALPNGQVHIIDLFEAGDLGPVADALRRVLVVGHDLKPALGHLSINFEMMPGQLFDTMVAHKLVDGGRHLDDDTSFTFAAACGAFLGVEPSPAPSAPTVHDVLSDDFAARLAMSMRPLLALEEALRVALHHAGLEQVGTLENALLPAVVEMQLAGVLIDHVRWAEVVAAWSKEMETLRQSLGSLLGVANVDNGAEVLVALQRLGVPVTRTKAEDLAPHMYNPAVEQLVRYRHLSGFVTGAGRTVLGLFERFGTGRVRTVLNQLGAASGRFSCRDPNLMGLPREAEVRGCIQAAPGMKLVVADYAAIELRVLADQIGEQRLIEVFLAGGNPHRLTASLVMGVPEAEINPAREQGAKAVNFGFVFGMGPESFVAYARKNFNIKFTTKDAAAFRQRFLAAYPGIAEWQRDMQDGMPCELRTASGRARFFDNPNNDYGARLSHAIQGTAADGMKRALVLLYNHPHFRQLGAKILLVIHDELLVEAPEAHADEVKEIVTRCMVEGMSTFVKAVPIVVKADVRSSWAKPTATAASAPATVGTATINASGAAYAHGSATAATTRRAEQRLYEAITDAQIANRFEKLEEEWRDEQ